MAKLRFPEKVGSLGDDDLFVGANQVAYGLKGDDVLRGQYGNDYSFLVGGPGDDTYVAADWAALTIIDSGGHDRLIADGIGVYRDSTFVATVEGGHLVAGDLYSGQQVAIADWQSPQHRIEEYWLADGTYSFEQIRTAVFSSPHYLGDLSTSDLVSEGMLPVGTTAADLDEFITHVRAREQELSREQLHEESRDTVQAMFVAYYARPADPAGLDYWTGRLVDARGDAQDITPAFGDSAEFLATYGGLSDDALITQLYQQLFDRDPDSGGLAFYAGELQSGAMSPADIALAIAKGAQGADAMAWQAKLAAADAFTAGLANTAGGQQAYGGDVSDIKTFIAGITGKDAFSPQEVDAQVAATVAEAAAAYHEEIQTLFVAYYGRPGDPDGLGFWAQQALASDGDLSSIVQAFGNSEEYTQTLGGLSEPEQVGVIFQQLFGRAPDAEGLDFYVGHLEAGNLSLADIALTVATGARGDDADILDARVGFAEAYTNTLNAQEKLQEFASPQGQAAVKAALDRIFSGVDAERELGELQGEPVMVELDALESTDATPFLFDAASDSFLFIDDVAEQSHTWIENFSPDDTLQVQGVAADEVQMSVRDQNTHIEFDDGQGTMSQIALIGIAGSHASVGEFNAAGLGEITLA